MSACLRIAGSDTLTRARAEFKARSAGHIITLGSIAGREAYPGGAIYCASKFAVNAFTSALLKELVSTPIRVSEIQPGMVETNFSVTRFRGDKSAADKVYEGLQPLTPEVRLRRGLGQRAGIDALRTGHCGGDRLGRLAACARQRRRGESDEQCEPGRG